MFEGLVHRVLVGYLGRFVKNIQKDQLKLKLWNEEVLLENVELIPEAFDYLQLPFALRQGRVGRLSIRVSWKKLGWDHPIIIALEDVFIFVSQRDDQEWGSEAVEKRELAGKKAQLAAAELAKLSRRVCENHAGKSFMSYITAKVLDSIQLSIKNFHVQYGEMQFESVLFGLRFSNLMIKQNLVGSFLKVATSQVSKIVDIEGLDIYCNTYNEDDSLKNKHDSIDCEVWYYTGFEVNKCDHLLQPVDVSVSLVINKPGKLDVELPQYSIKADITGLAMSLNEVQLHQILILLDYLSMSHLRERYGRYRPWGSPLSKKLNGWAKLWWHYAQESVLSDVRRRLKKTSWRYLGQRLSYRRKYITLYKTKLDLLRQELPIDEHVLLELEQMEKECDVDDILIYRSAAEHELQEVLSNSLSSNVGVDGTTLAAEGSRIDERRSRGWLNWLSRGMLGAGGTDDSIQFSGVVTDEVVEDIYKATKFHPSLVSIDADINHKMLTCVIKLNILQLSVTLQNKTSSEKIADLIIEDSSIEYKLWEDVASFIFFAMSGVIVNISKEKLILKFGQSRKNQSVQKEELNPCRVQVDLSPNHEVEISTKVMLQPVEVYINIEFLQNLNAFLAVLTSVNFQHDRVLLSLDGIKDIRTRLSSKAEFILSGHKRLDWDVNINNLAISVPWINANSDCCNLAFELGSLRLTSQYKIDSADSIQRNSAIWKQLSSSTPALSYLKGFCVQDLYENFEVQLDDLELKLIMPQPVQVISVVEKCCSSINMAFCVIPYESSLKQLEVIMVLGSLNAHFSQLIYESLVTLIAYVDGFYSRPEYVVLEIPDSFNSISGPPQTIGFSVTAYLGTLCFHVNLSDDGESYSEVMVTLQDSVTKYSHLEYEDCIVTTRALKIVMPPLKDDTDTRVLCTSGNLVDYVSSHRHDFGVTSGNSGNSIHGSTFTEPCMVLHYKFYKSVHPDLHEFTVSLDGAHLHFYPYVFGLLFSFCNRISLYTASSSCDNSFDGALDAKDPKGKPRFSFEKFGYSNFGNSENDDINTISLDRYPFVTIYNSGSLDNLENSLCYSPSNWRNFANLREKKDRSPNLRMESGTCSSSAYTSPSSTSGNFGKASIFNGNINLSGLRVHLHDSSCIVGTLSVPIAKSSILSCDDFMDVLFSTEGMVLSSSWWTKNVQEFMWGPSLSSLSPILNLRIRKGVAELSSSQLEVSIGIQHVCCTLSAEYLAIIIGYFSLPDWCSNLTEHDTENPKYADMESDIDIVYKFEILDSTLIVPVEQVECPYLKLDLLQFYCSFMLQSAQNSASTNIPRECEILDHKVAGVNHCLNIFGRDLNLFLMLYKYDNNGLIETDQYNSFSYIPLIAPLNVDVSIRMQYENESYMQTSPVATCIMSRIGSCQLIVDDCYTSKGVQALLDFINQLSTVEEESKHFTSDVSSFLQFKRSVKENAIVPPVASDLISFEIQCFADKLSMELRHLKEDTASSESVGRADMKFQCSVCLENDALKNLDLHFYSLTLHSSRNPVLLIQCLDVSASPSSLHICLSRLEKSQNEFYFSLPSLDIWLYLYEWIGIIDLLNSIVQSVDKANLVEVSLKGTSGIATGLTEHVGVSASQGYPINGSESNNILDHVNQKAAVYTLRSDNVGLQVHFPLSTIEATLGGLAMDKKAHDESWKSRSTNSNVQNSEKFVAVSARSRSIELSINGRNVKQNSIWEKISGAFGICEDNSIDDNWPLFQISQLTVITDIPDNQMEILSVHLDCNQLDLWISYRVFCFLYGLRFDVPGATSSNSSLANMDLDLNLRKVSLQISDERWSCGGLLLEILLRNFRCSANLTENNIKSSIFSELEVNYNNIHKVFWEPFVEPWNFQINFTRKQEISALLSGSVATEVHLASSAALNLNFTEPLAESVFRTMEMVNDARYFMESNCSSGTERFLTVQVAENVCERRYTPYVLQNLTSLPLLYHVFRGLFSADELNISDMNDGKLVEPGASVPIYFSETLEEQLSRFRPAQSSDRLNENQLNGPVHHFMRIRLEGMSLPSAPISMDLVGLTYFEVYVSSASSKTDLNKGGDIKKQIAHAEESSRSHTNDGFAVPVVFDVSMQRYSKLIRLYSTVILSNATSVPLELRFDIPLGVSPKILDPVYPGQKVPLPLHLAEAGRIRWRPLGNTYLWSETHDISNILSKESNLGFLRSFVCYPSNPSSDPFRCCISVQNFTLPSASMPNKSFYHHVNNATTRKSEIGARSIRQLTLSTPLIASNYLSEEVLLSIESGGITRKILLSEVETSIHHVDPSHDLSLELNINGYQTSHLKFPRTETFSSLAKFSGRKFSLTESVTVYPHQFNGPLSINIEKMMDPFSGARELYLSVPFLIYNCLGIPLTISELTGNTKGCCCTVPSCYNLEDNEPLHVKRMGLSLLSLDQDSYAMAEESQGPSHLTRIALPKKTVDRQVGKILSNPLLVSSEFAHKQSNMHEAVCQKDSPDVDSSSFSNGQNSNFVNNDNIKVKPCMYSPHAISSISEATVRVSKWSPLYDAGSVPNPLWSEPFLLVPPSGSSTVLVPRSTSSAAAYILSVTSTALVGSFARHTQAVSFQPRYVISNGCNKDLCFRQKGTDAFIHLRVGQHSHLHWTDTTRELLISIRFNEPGWQWSGSFLPDHLGDTQLKMWNCDTGALTITRVEVQTADVSSRDEKIVGSLHGNSGTNLILISDDDTGFMPYRIDNFTKERLRVYQQKCETFDTVIHPYTSRPYAWDEPSFPHRLSIELPGERVIGSYMLDDIREYEPVHLKSTAEKPERILLVCIRAEGARKVLSIMDSSCHLLNDLGDPSLPRLPERKRTEQRQKNSVNYKEEFSVSIPQIGISLINAYPQELLFVCAKKITLDLLQSLDQQKLSFELFSLQIDNQLHSTPYPVILSFNEIKSNTLAQRTMDDGSESKSRGASQIASDCPFKPAIHLSLAIWRRRDISLVSFEYIRLRVANFRLELEQELILSLIDFFKAVSLRSESKVLSFSDPMNYQPVYNLGVSHGQTDDYNRTKENWSYAKNVLKDSEDSIEVASLPSVVPVGAPWQQIYLLAKRHKKMMYVELFDMAPIYFSLSFSSSPWMLRNGFLAAGDSLIHRGLVALADVEGAQIRLKRLTVSHQMASWESMQDIVIRHYMRQFLLEMYKVFGSAGVIGNPMGFARSLGLGIRDFLSVPARSILQSPTELITGVAQGTSSLVSNTVYALSDAATQFSKAAHKGIVAFAFDDQSVARMEKDQRGASSHSRGVINEVFEGFTGLLQSPIKEAEKHGLPGLFKGLAYGVTGLVARPAASILEVTGKAAQSIRNRSRLYQQHYRVRFPRPLSRELPLKPYSLEEAVGALVLMRSDGGDQRLKDELLVTCKSLKEEGKFVVVTEKLLLVVSCSSLADAGKPEPRGVPVDPKWIIESEISLESIIHVDTEEDAVHIVGSSSDDLQRRNHPQSKKDGRRRWRNPSTSLPLLHTNLEFATKNDAADFFHILLCTIEQGKERGWGSGPLLLHQSNINVGN